MKKIWMILLSMAVILGLLSGCAADGKQQQENEKAPAVSMKIAVLKGPTGMGMAKLMDDAANGQAEGSYSFEVNSDTSLVMSKVISGEYDVAALPTNSAAMAYQKTGGEVQMLAINTLGTLYLLQNTDKELPKVEHASDLAGATIVTFGQGANPEYVLRHILEENQLDPDHDVTIEFKASVDEVLALAIAGEVDYIMVPEPNATVVQTKNPAFQVALDLNAEWESAQGQLVMGCLVTTKAFAEQHPEALKTFLKEYEASVHYTRDSAEEAAGLCAAHEIVPSEAIAKNSLPGCHLTFVAGTEMQKTVDNYYQVLFGYNPASIGGAVPDEGFYCVP